MCCEGFHDVKARLDVPGQVRFVTVCAVCGREQREIGRRPYTPDPHLGFVRPIDGTGERPAVAAVAA